MLKPDTLYCSIDIETDGPCAGINNMLSLACVLYTHEGKEVGFYDRNLWCLPDLKPDHATMLDFWADKPEVWARARDQQVNPSSVIYELNQWLKWELSSLEAKRMETVCYPVSFDFGFVNYYTWRFLGFNPFGYRAWDIRSLWEGAGRPFEIELDNPHVAIDDARNQGELFFKVVERINLQQARLRTIARM